MERRLAAIFYADVAGYSRLTGEDEEGTHKTLKASLEFLSGTIESHGGRVVHYAGDAVLAEFPSVVDALTAAVEGQRELGARNKPLEESKKLQFRIGINLGDVIFDDPEIYGDGVNIAARLEALADPGGICISRPVHDQVKNKIDLDFDFMGEQQVKNIAEPVPAYRVVLEPGEQGNRAASKPAKPWRAREILVGAVLAGVIAIGFGAYWFSARPPPAPDAASIAAQQQAATVQAEKPSIAVLPFTNMSGDEEQEYFSDGMTDDLITDLSKISALTVIARTSTFAYKNKSPDIRDVAKALGVRYVLEGSVRKVGGRVRINVQLIDAETGGHLWAERYDRELKDIFALQDEVRGKIIQALAVRLTPAEKRVVQKGTESIAAYDLYLRAVSMETVFTRAANGEAIELYEQAIAIDPGYSGAYARMANLYQLAATFGWAGDREKANARAIQLVEKAIALDDENPFAHWSLGRIAPRRTMAHAGGVERGIKALERAIELEPSYAAAYAFLSYIYAGVGRIDDGFKSMKTAMRLNPLYPFWYLHNLGVIHYMAGEFDAAVANIEKAAERNPTALFVRWWLAAAYAQAGRREDAEWEVEEIQGMGLKPTVEDILDQSPINGAAQVELFAAGLRKAGIPEKAEPDGEAAPTIGASSTSR